ncbi:DUF6380 family protein [Streptomyces luteolifulvus]|uniref:DUF6380 family protein n=1 Tax=Streptomyces luteolifulvus TaxID=2615112 RepID=UPI001CD95441
MDNPLPVPREATFDGQTLPAGAPGDATGEKRHATLRLRAASLTATACRAPFNQHDGRVGEGAR